MSQISGKDLEFINVDPGLAEMVLDVCRLNIEDLNTAINSPKNLNDELAEGLTPEKISEMLVFYESLLNILIDKELYEDCTKLTNILNYLKNLQGKVGSH